MFYEELQSYPPDLEIDQITQVMKELAYNQRFPQTKSTRDQSLMELAAKKVEIQAHQNLEKAEAFLAHVSHKPNAIPVIEGKVYVEIFEQGQGELIKPDNVVYITFKQYDIEGNILRDTQEKSFPVHLSRMIKGFQLGIKDAREGESRRITIHPDYGFGRVGRGDHSNQVLIYEVKIESIYKNELKK